MTERLLERAIRVERPLAEVFAFFADPGNLEALTPPWLRFRILTPGPIAMRPGQTIDYRLVLRRIPLRWRSEITVWEPPHRFVDEQRRGPYRLWVHEHRFRECARGSGTGTGPGTATEIVDRVRYAAPGGRLVERLVVDRDLERIFDYREERIAALLGGSPPARRVALPGGAALAEERAGA